MDTLGSQIETPFRERVYELVRQIPEGCVTTYGSIARALGAPRSARMVGWAMASSPDDVSEVAHRVVNRYGELSGGWSWGHPDVMRSLLEEEGVPFTGQYTVDLQRCFWMPPASPE
jgi:methylated-DNA-protein-cysteine methyltransferase related protein